MRYLMGLVLAGGMLLGVAGESRAQFGLSIGNPYAGQGLVIGAPGYGYSSGYSGFTGYGSGLPGYYNSTNYFSNTGYLAGPGTFGYSSGYRGYVAPVVPYARPYYGSYGYGGYGYGGRYGYRPFRGAGRMFR